MDSDEGMSLFLTSIRGSFCLCYCINCFEGVNCPYKADCRLVSERSIGSAGRWRVLRGCAGSLLCAHVRCHIRADRRMQEFFKISYNTYSQYIWSQRSPFPPEKLEVIGPRLVCGFIACNGWYMDRSLLWKHQWCRFPKDNSPIVEASVSSIQCIWGMEYYLLVVYKEVASDFLTNTGPHRCIFMNNVLVKWFLEYREKAGY